VQVTSTRRCRPVCLKASESDAKAVLGTLRTDVTRYLSRCESALSVTVSPTPILSSRAKNPNALCSRVHVSCDHSGAERLACPCAAIPPPHVLNVLRHLELAVDRTRWLNCRARVARKFESIWDEFDDLADSGSTLQCGSNRRRAGRSLTGCGRGVRRGLRRTAIKAGQQATRDDPGLPGQESQRARFTSKSGMWPKAWPPVPVATSSGFSPSVVLAESTRRATFVVF
jgi:hypothetical protein